jgi:hypothetical protein
LPLFTKAIFLVSSKLKCNYYLSEVSSKSYG